MRNSSRIYGIVVFVSIVFFTNQAVQAVCDVGAPITATATDSSTTLNTGIKVFNSTQVGEDSLATRTAADALDDLWESETTSAGLTLKNSPWNGGTTVGSIAPPYSLFTLNTITVTAALQNMVNLSTNGHDCDGTVNAGGQVLANSSTLQDNAPRPAQLFDGTCASGANCSFWNEPNAGSSTSRNAILFEFSQPVKAFGAWFGDVETRTDGNGTAAIVRFLDASDNKIGEDVIIEPQPVSEQNNTTCGGDTTTTSPSNCGNEVTRWIGFQDTNTTARIKKFLVVVGDDDDSLDSGTNDGFTEHLSFIGAKLALVPNTAANVSVNGRVLSPFGRGLRNVVVSLTDENGNNIVSRTNAFGYFKFTEVQSGNNYVLRAISKQYNSNPQLISVFDNISGLEINLY